MNREEWLHNAVEIFRPWFDELDAPLPAKILVGVGFPSKGIRGKVIGECWSTVASEGEVNQIFIHPRLSEPGEMLGTLLHELIHAADNCQHGHRGPFATMARTLGFLSPLTQSAHQRDELKGKLREIGERLGTYPHQEFLATGRRAGPKPQTNRHIKLVATDCPEACGYQVRGTRARIEKDGYPLCPHGTVMFEEK